MRTARAINGSAGHANRLRFYRSDEAVNRYCELQGRHWPDMAAKKEAWAAESKCYSAWALGRRAHRDSRSSGSSGSSSSGSGDGGSSGSTNTVSELEATPAWDGSLARDEGLGFPTNMQQDSSMGSQQLARGQPRPGEDGAVASAKMQQMSNGRSVDLSGGSSQQLTCTPGAGLRASRGVAHVQVFTPPGTPPPGSPGSDHGMARAAAAFEVRSPVDNLEFGASLDSGVLVVDSDTSECMGSSNPAAAPNQTACTIESSDPAPLAAIGTGEGT